MCTTRREATLATETSWPGFVRAARTTSYGHVELGCSCRVPRLFRLRRIPSRERVSDRSGTAAANVEVSLICFSRVPNSCTDPRGPEDLFDEVAAQHPRPTFWHPQDRLVTKAWTLTQVEAELGAAPATLRRLLDQHQVRRMAPTRRQRAAAAAAIGPTKQARAVQQRRQARLTELGFASLEEYVQDRYLTRGWPRRRLCAELGVGYDWLDQQLTRLRLRD